MSMHQPLAGFLVRGIKIHEGRTWYTAHRGRFVARPLWPFSTLLTLRCPSIVPRCVDYGSQPLRNNPPTTRLSSGKRLTLRSTPVRQTLGPSFSSCLVARVPTPLGFFSGTWQTIMGRETPHPTHNLYAQPSLFAPAWFFSGYRFPDSYPTSCLLGYVDVEDCLSQEEYRQTYPDGLSLSPFVLVCTNPHELVVRLPIKGRHKIYALDGPMHTAAKAGVRPAQTYV